MALKRSEEGALQSRPLQETLGLVVGVTGVTALILGVILYVIDPGIFQLARSNLAFGFVCCLFYALTHRRHILKAMGSRSMPLLALEFASAAGVLGGLFAVNWAFLKDPTEWDLTRDKLFSLHPQSVEVAKQIDTSVVVFGFFAPADPMRGRLREAVALYRNHTEQLRFKPVNPDRAPESLVKKFDLSAQSARIVVHHEATDRFIKVAVPTEEALTNALLQLAEDKQRVVYVVQGHREPNFAEVRGDLNYGLARRQLENEGLRVETLLLSNRQAIPEDAKAVLIARPETSFLPNETSILRAYLARGGRLGVLIEPRAEIGLASMLEDYRVILGRDLVIEKNPAAAALDFGEVAPMVNVYETHPITRVMRNQVSLFFRARSISPGPPSPAVPKAQVSTLIQTSPSSFAETSTNGQTALDSADLAGPVPIAAAVTFPTAGHPRSLAPEARLVVFGDADFPSNRFVPVRGNLDLFLNSVQWLVGKEDRITIRPPQRVGDRLSISKSTQFGMMFFSVNLLPLLIFGSGLSVWALRRRR